MSEIGRKPLSKSNGIVPAQDLLGECRRVTT
ncbi:MAG: hypothetical protein H6Q87_796, partial [candidate division NC10 bacterium]|nr:hypothetical protein [candidate division NC10 bacterium]